MERSLKNTWFLLAQEHFSTILHLVSLQVRNSLALKQLNLRLFRLMRMFTKNPQSALRTLFSTFSEIS